LAQQFIFYFALKQTPQNLNFK